MKLKKQVRQCLEAHGIDLQAVSNDRLREVLSYDPNSGLFVWIETTCRNGLVNVGDTAGSLHTSGYINISVDGKIYRAHRLAWLYVHGVFPPEQIDHVNGVKSDNRITNLRLATNSENACNKSRQLNNGSGWKGVSWCSQTEMWKAQVKIQGKGLHIGRYDSIHVAAQVYNHVAQQIHAEFACMDLPDWLIADAVTIKRLGGNMKQISKALTVAAIHHAQQERTVQS